AVLGLFTQDVPIIVTDAGLTLTPATFSATVGQPFSSVTVATFTDDNPLSDATDFTATIDWGDGVVEDGQVTGSAGAFTVTGGHLYTSAESFPVSVTVVDPHGANASGTGPASVTGPVSVQLVSVSSVEGASTGSVPVATFTATDPGPFTAAIDWGDG